MFDSVRGWFNRNRTRLALSAGVVGGIYVAGHYALNKLTEARQRMSDDRIARENLRRRFAQNQEDCTYTVLALLPTATENILKELPVEAVTQELQARKTERMSRSTASSEIAPSEVPSTLEGLPAGTKSSNDADAPLDASITSSGFVRASQVVDAEQSPADAVGPKKSKLELWDDVKIYSITRAFTLIYSLALLTLLTRIQLNLLGRRNYLSSVVSLAAAAGGSTGISMEDRDDGGMGSSTMVDEDGNIVEKGYGSDFDTNRKYLTFSWWLLHRGWKDVKSRVEAAVRSSFGGLAPRDNVTFGQLSALVNDVRGQMEGSSEEEKRAQRWLNFLLPAQGDEEMVLRESGVVSAPPADKPMISQSLRRLLDETSDLIDSPSFTQVMELLLDSAFSLLVDDKLAVQAFKIPPQKGSRSNGDDDLADILQSNPLLAGRPRIEELADDGINPLASQTPCKLATILAVMTRSAHAIGNGGSLDSLIGDGSVEFPGLSSSNALKNANEYLAAMESVRDLEGFAAVVYSSNFEFESMEAEAEKLSAAAKGSAIELQESYVDVSTDGAGDDGDLQSAWDRASTR